MDDTSETLPTNRTSEDSTDPTPEEATDDPVPAAEGGDDTGDTGGTAADKPTDDADSKEVGGRDGPEPTRYGDWEVNGRCVDF